MSEADDADRHVPLDDRDAWVRSLRGEAVDHHHRADRFGHEFDFEFLFQLRRDVGHHVLAMVGRDGEIDLHLRARVLRGGDAAVASTAIVETHGNRGAIVVKRLGFQRPDG